MTQLAQIHVATKCWPVLGMSSNEMQVRAPEGSSGPECLDSGPSFTMYQLCASFMPSPVN